MPRIMYEHRDEDAKEAKHTDIHSCTACRTHVSVPMHIRYTTHTNADKYTPYQIRNKIGEKRRERRPQPRELQRMCTRETANEKKRK